MIQSEPFIGKMVNFLRNWHLLPSLVLIFCILVKRTYSASEYSTFSSREKLPINRSSISNDENAVVNTNLEFNAFHFDAIHDGEKPQLIPCDNDNCTKINSFERICFKCDSKDDPNCANEVNDSMSQLCPFADEDLGCFHMINDSNVIRGCTVELEESDKQKCLANDDSCKSCFETEGCNRQQSFSKCYAIDQSIEVPLHVFDRKMWPKICAKYNDTCFTLLLQNYTVIRGCVDEYAAENGLPPNFLVENEENYREYEVCSTPLCNYKPLTASFCLACNSDDDSECREKARSSRICPLQTNPSGCYHFDNGSYVERGCITELKGDQRKNCESNSETCKTCTGYDCNKKMGFISCVTQDTTQNVNINSTLCRRYGNRCYIHVVRENVRRGCLDDIVGEPDTQLDIVSDCRNNQDICQSCTGNLCNSRPVSEEYCFSCHSPRVMNDNCQYAPLPYMKLKCPLSLRRLGCYLWKDNLFVERGCVSELDPESRHLCQTPSTNTTCKMCKGDGCNEKTSFQTCIDSSSETDENCLDCKGGVINMKTSQCANYLSQCYTHVKNGIVTRGCTDSFEDTPENCASDPEHCLLCSKFLCNQEAVHRDICMSCDSDTNPNCRLTSNITGESLFTENSLSIINKGCFHFVDEKTDRHIRGHVSQLSNDELKQYSGRDSEFRICKGANCNVNPFLPKCIVCDSTEDLNCAINPGPSHIQVCPKYESECFTLINEHNIIRGCLDDSDFGKSIKFEMGIPHGKSDVCSTATGPGCNNVKLNAQKCIECYTITDPRCRTNPELMEDKICHKFRSTKHSGCYLRIEGDEVNRGCIQDLEPAKTTECLDNSDTCKICTGARCNAKAKFQECYGCNGENDPQCANNAELTNTEMCKDYHSSCAIGIDRKGFTHRRCIDESSNFNKEFPNNTFTCHEDKCNVEIFPKDRLKCYQCNGNEACNLDTSMKPEPCRIYTEYDQCFTYMGEDKEVFRGCLSDTSKERILCERNNKNDKGTCVICPNTGCNNQPKVRQPKFACVNCTGSDECAFGYNASMAVPCKKDVELGDEESCFTRSINGTEQVERGCTLDIDSKLNEEYKTCSEPVCNIGNVRFSWCLRCQSGIDGNCSVIQSPFEYIQYCDHSVYTYDRRGCFTSHQNGIISRGCTADLTEEEYEKCHGDDSCTLCTDDYCNKEETSASIKVSVSSLLCLLAFFSTYIQCMN
ncbi:uncharacterized protein LOC129572482 [Sitodiplosis mosellana]|uniref:uncharacterized protein LOC129572482 n=1 Tax=Sitodiplosis mosellana TaxID=263140 RepID=UPI00244518CB|nr:uncharacterized protein LOC129572482 [Sitodiplosis mosellana]